MVTKKRLHQIRKSISDGDVYDLKRAHKEMWQATNNYVSALSLWEAQGRPVDDDLKAIRERYAGTEAAFTKVAEAMGINEEEAVEIVHSNEN